tara:strand:+ start:16476 stop:17309 length:834 start_codon:yes stop_codon:yes gene_type:complete
MSDKIKYLCGNAFKSICKYSSGSYTESFKHDFDFRVKKDIDNNLVFVKTEYLEHFFCYIKLDFDYTLISHNSDLPINDSLLVDGNSVLEWIDNPQIKRWYTQNVCCDHPKVHSIPIGIGNPKWKHGNEKDLDEAIANEYWKNKNNLVYCNFNISTNTLERTKCLQYSGMEMPNGNGGYHNLGFAPYLKELGESYFVLSPNGNGVDCHKHWESLYLKTIPIVTKSRNMEFYEDLPFLIIDDWRDYKNLNLSKELYDEIWGDFNPESLYFDDYVNSMQL